MTETIYLLWFVQERDDAADTELLIGAFTSEADAKIAIDQLKSRPGFVAYPAGFQIHAQKIGQIGWTEGFVEETAMTPP
jgi:homoserine kinase type II